MEIGDQDFYLDLLFYHLRLRAYVVIELKMTAFKPEYAGKMNFYLSAVDDLLRHEQDQPSIGIVLCKTKNKVMPNMRCATHRNQSASRRFSLRSRFLKNYKAAFQRLKNLKRN